MGRTLHSTVPGWIFFSFFRDGPELPLPRATYPACLDVLLEEAQGRERERGVRQIEDANALPWRNLPSVFVPFHASIDVVGRSTFYSSIQLIASNRICCRL